MSESYPKANTTKPDSTTYHPRTRLFDLLDRHPDHPVVWLSGPAGSGKTSLVASYIDARAHSHVWYRIGRANGDLAGFFHFLGLASHTGSPQPPNPLPSFTPEWLPELGRYIRFFLGQISPSLEPPGVIVLDDVGWAEDGRLIEVIRQAADLLPRGVRLLATSRHEPPRLLARLVDEGRMLVVGWPDLRLDIEEFEALLKRHGVPPVPHETVVKLHRQMDGWAGSLPLLAQALQGQPGELEGVLRLQRQEVKRYFADQVWEQLDASTREFLLQTAWAPHLTAEAARKITGREDADQTLAGLARENLFTARVSSPEPCFVYHDLFRAYLQARARERFPPGEQERLKIEVARSLEEQGETGAALDLYREAGRWDRYTELVLRSAASVTEQGRLRTLEGWLSVLPEKMVEDHPWLSYWSGSCRLHSRPETARTHLARAGELFAARGERTGVFLAWAGLVESHIHDLEGLQALDGLIAEFHVLRETYPRFPSHQVELKVTVSLLRALSVRRPGHPEIERWSDRAMALAAETGNPRAKILAAVFLTNLAYFRGELRKAQRLIEYLPAEPLREPIPAILSILIHQSRAVVHWMSGRWRQCLAEVDAGVRLGQQLGVGTWHLMLAIHGGCCALDRGDRRTAEVHLDVVRAGLLNASATEQSSYHVLSAWLELLRGEAFAAQVHAREAISAAVRSGFTFTEHVSRLALAAALIEGGEGELAAEQLAVELDAGPGNRSGFVVPSALLLRARLSLETGDEAKGLAALAEALALLAEKGHQYLLMVPPRVLSRLLGRALAAGIEVPCVRRLIEARALQPHGDTLALGDWPWPVKIHTFGAFQVWLDGEPLRFAGKAQQRPIDLLKAVLAIGAGRNVREEAVADELWPDATGDVAHKNFTTTLHRLRRLLGRNDALTLSGGRLTLNPSLCWVDLWAFEQGVGELGNSGGPSSEPRGPDRMARIRRTLALYRGPFLAHDDGQLWAVSRREHLRDQYIRAVEQGGEFLERSEQWEQAKGLYQEALAIEDLVEGFYRRLMVCCQRLGQAAEAVAAYERCRRVLESQLGVSPSPATDEVLRSVRNS